MFVRREVRLMAGRLRHDLGRYVFATAPAISDWISKMLRSCRSKDSLQTCTPSASSSCADTRSCLRLADAALQHEAHAQQRADPLDAVVAALEGKRRRAADHVQLVAPDGG